MKAECCTAGTGLRSPARDNLEIPSQPMRVDPHSTATSMIGLKQAAHAMLTKQELHTLADGLLVQDHTAIDDCIAFVLAETRGLWHGRARAMMCRRLKHCALGRTHSTQLLRCILQRLQTGAFSEQFKDQLRLAMHLNPKQTLAAGVEALASSRPHVRRYALWLASLP